MTARRAEQSGEHFDLLPFISIMMCVLACLLLITLSVAALSLASAGEEWTPPCPKDTGAGFDDRSRLPALLIWDGSTVLASLNGERVCVMFPPGQADVRCPKGYRVGVFDEIISYFQTRHDSAFAFFAIRPSGFERFPALRNAFQRNNIDLGFEPIGQNKEVRLSRTSGQKRGGCDAAASK